MPCYVLVVEDDLLIAAHLGHALARGGFRPRLAGNVEEALLLLEEYGAPLFVIIDLSLPMMGGVEFAATIKRDRRCSEISVLAMISGAADSLTPQGASLFSGFMKKPFADHELPRTLVRAKTDRPGSGYFDLP